MRTTEAYAVLCVMCLAAAFLAARVLITRLVKKESPKRGRITIMHASGCPCPEGYHLVPDLFIQTDGWKEDGFVADDLQEASSVLIDFRRPGEGITMAMFAVVDPKR